MHLHCGFGLAAILLFGAIMVYLRPLRPSLFRVQFSGSERRFRDLVAPWSPEAHRRFQAHFPADWVLITLYIVAGWSYGHSAVVAHAGSNVATLATWALPAAGMADLVENIFQGRFMRARAQARALPARDYRLANLASGAKLLGLGVFVLVMVRVGGPGCR